VLVVAVAGDVDGLERPDRVAVAVAVVRLVLRLEGRALGDVRLEPQLADDGVEAADVVGVGVGDDQPLGVDAGRRDAV